MRRSKNKPTTGLPEVPSEWEPPTDLASTIAQWFGVSEATIAVEFADAVWTGSLRPAHRIVGVTPHTPRRGQGHRQFPPGLSPVNDPADLFSLNFNSGSPRWQDSAIRFGSDRFICDDWDIARVDRRKGTVAGWELTDGTTVRLVIEVNWQAARAWAGHHLKRWKIQEGSSIPATTSKATARTPVIAPPRVGAARGGAPPSYDWAAFTRELVREANLSGFDTRAEMAAHMRKYVEDNWEKQPDTETLRRKLKVLYPDDLPE